ncbi:MAG TPA: glycosyltransferase family 39 protein [Chloroflexota bacterium]|nr:glycosyltransferase family 39 protein [Chloroflexota bacterium]
MERAAPPRHWVSLALVLAVALVWRAPSFFDPPWVNDEGTYFAVAQAVDHGYRLYAGIWENKPPAIYLLYALVYHWLGASLPAVRVVAAAAALLVTAGLTISARSWLGSRAPVAALLAGLVLGVPFLEGTTANAEIFLIACTTWAVVLALREHAALAGFLMGVAILFKVVALFDAAALGLFLLLQPSLSVRRPASYVIGLAIPIAIVVGWAAQAGVLAALARDALVYDLGYVAHANGGPVPWLLLLKLTILAGLTAVLIARPFPVLWLAWSAAGALWSGRPFGHYFLQVVPALSIVVVMALPHTGDTARFLRRWFVALPALFVLAAGASALAGWMLAVAGHDSIAARRLQWYANAVRLGVGQETYAQYSAEVDDHVERNIALAAGVRRMPAGPLLVWGNVPWVYVLSGRLPATPYTSAYRDPPVPGEVTALRHAIEHRVAPVVLVINPPLPPLDGAGRALREGYRLTGRVGAGAIYAVRAPRG